MITIRWTQRQQHEVSVTVEQFAEITGHTVEMVKAAIENDHLSHLCNGLADDLAKLDDDGFECLYREDIEVGDAAPRVLPVVPDDYPVKVLGPDDEAEDRATCGECGRSWDDAVSTSLTPAPSGRCPFEYYH